MSGAQDRCEWVNVSSGTSSISSIGSPLSSSITPSLLRYDTIRDAILACARKPTRISLIYRTEPTTIKCKREKLKSKDGYAQK